MTGATLGRLRSGLAAILLLGCGGGPDPDGGTGGAPSFSQTLLLVADVDDDDQNGLVDWLEPLSNKDNEVASIELPGELLAAMEANHVLALALDGDVEDITVQLDGEAVLGRTGEAQPVTSVEVPGSAAHGALTARCGTFHRKATLQVRHLDASGAERATLVLDLRGAPLVLNHHLQDAERVWVVRAPDNGALVEHLEGLLGQRLVKVQSPDVWIQDELEWATVTAPGKRLDVAMDSIRDRELDAYVKSLAAPDVQPITWGVEGTAVTEDKFGNLETTPPLTGYPFGRVYYGDNGAVGPNPILKDLLDEQQLQAPIHVDTSFLCVGHVDELMTFVADPSSPKGFKLLFADVPSAYASLAGSSPSAALPRYAGAHGYATVGDLSKDSALQALNDDVQGDYLGPILAGLQATLGLDDADVVRVPALFERVPDCWYSGELMEVAALVPAMVNLAVVNLEGAAPRLVVPDPFFRPDGHPQSSDPFIQAFRAGAPSAYTVDFIDDWYTYHVSMGEVHCGTNVQRTPAAVFGAEGRRLLDATASADGPGPFVGGGPAGAPRRTRAGTLRFSEEVVHGNPAATAELLRRLAQEPSAELRAALVFALPRTRGVFYEEVVAHLQREQAPSVRRALVSVMPRAAGEGAAAGVMLGLRDPDAGVRAEAAMVAGSLAASSAEIMGRLTHLLADPDARVRASAARSLGVAARPGSFEAVARLLGDPASMVRLEAARALGRAGRDHAATLPSLRALVMDPDARVAGAARRITRARP